VVTPGQVIGWDVSGLRTSAKSAADIADSVLATANRMHSTIYDLQWSGQARSEAEDKADRERNQIRAIAAAFDELSTAMSRAAGELEHPISEVRSILRHYAVPPVSVSDDWLITGVDDWNSEAGSQLSRLGGLVATLVSADTQWGAKIAQINDDIVLMAPESARQLALAAIASAKHQNSRADPEGLRASATAFETVFGRAPSTPNDWKTAEALNPHSFDPKYDGVPPGIKIARIEPVPGQGVIRAALFIPPAEVFNVPDNDLGDGRAEDPNFDPEHARVALFVDYENGLIIARQNPSVTTTGEVRVGEPDVRAQQTPDGSIMVQYDAKNPFAPPGAELTGHTVNGTVVLAPASGNPGTPRVVAGGEITDYPSIEIYQDNSAGQGRPVLVDPADSGSQWGPLVNLPDFHEVGGGKKMFEPFRADFEDPDWERNKPTPLGSPDDPPQTVVVR
jgi:uncharacterized protein YukE